MNIKELLQWKSLYKKGKNVPSSVEEYNIDYTNKCGGRKLTDVLYSFLGIYAIGVWVYNKDNQNCKQELFSISNKIHTLNREGKKQILCSKKFLNDLQDDEINGINVKNLNEYLEKTFVPVYFHAGNLIPMWPGGNTYRGNQNNGFMDIPEIFFHKYPFWFNALKQYPNAFLDEMGMQIDQSRFESLGSFLESVNGVEKYEQYIEDIVKIINNRSENIKTNI